jgi:hypothetical protein
LLGEHLQHCDNNPDSPGESNLGPAGGGEGGHEPQLHHGRLPHLLAPFLHLDAAGSPHGEEHSPGIFKQSMGGDRNRV